MPFDVHTTKALPLIDRVTVDGFRCVCATRTIIDLARASVSPVTLEAAIDSAVRLGLSAPHRRDGKTFARVDFLFDQCSVVVEVSGKLGHSAPAARS